MYLQLAERKRGRVSVSGYTRRSRVRPHTRKYPLNENGEEDNPYIFLPNFDTGGGVFVREDKFDSIPDDQWAVFMNAIASYQPEVQRGMSEACFLSSRADRRAKRERRNEARTKRKETRAQNKEDRNTRRNERAESKADARQTRAEARMTRAEGKGGFDWDKAKEIGGSLINKFTGGGGGDDMPADQGGSDSSTPFYKQPTFLIIAAAAAAGGIYLATRPKGATT